MSEFTAHLGNPRYAVNVFTFRKISGNNAHEYSIIAQIRSSIRRGCTFRGGLMIIKLLHPRGMLSAVALAGLAWNTVAHAQDESDAPESQREELENIVVTGTRLSSRGFDTPTPVSVVGAEEFTLPAPRTPSPFCSTRRSFPETSWKVRNPIQCKPGSPSAWQR